MSHRKYGLDHLGCRTARRLVSPALALWLCSQPFAARADLYFNPRFLADDPAAVADLSGFEKGRGSARHLSRRYLSQQWFYDHRGRHLPCRCPWSRSVPLPDTRPAGEHGCGYRSGAGHGDAGQHGLRAADHAYQRSYHALRRRTAAPVPHRPQAFMGNHSRGYIPPELWDNGITAGLINYNFTGNNAHNTTGGSSRYAYLNLQSGLNIGAWRLRDNSTGATAAAVAPHPTRIAGSTLTAGLSGTSRLCVRDSP